MGMNSVIMAEATTWLVMSEGMGDGGFEWVLASWDTKPESWEETLLSRWAPAEGIRRRLWTGEHIRVNPIGHKSNWGRRDLYSYKYA